LMGLLSRIEGAEERAGPQRRPAYVRKTAGYPLHELRAGNAGTPRNVDGEVS